MNTSLVLTIVFFMLSAILEDVVTNQCDDIPDSGKLCHNKIFDPNDLLHVPTYNPLEIGFVKMKGQISLSSPEKLKLKPAENAAFKRFYITDSCITNIEDGFFYYIDGGHKTLSDITFSKVTCLGKLSSNSFRGIGDFVKVLTFDTMVNLSEIEEDFFDSLHVLEKLTIVNTRIRTLPIRMLTKMPRLTILNLYSNQLTVLPLVPSERIGFIDKIHADKNPFDCQCLLRPFVENMRTVLSRDSYRCATPEHLRDHALIDADMCGVPTLSVVTTGLVKAVENKQAVATAIIRIEILIAVSMIILAIVMVVIIVVLYKRHTAQKKEMTVCHQQSPSKIIFQNNGDLAEPFLMKMKS